MATTEIPSTALPSMGGGKSAHDPNDISNYIRTTFNGENVWMNPETGDVIKSDGSRANAFYPDGFVGPTPAQAGGYLDANGQFQRTSNGGGGGIPAGLAKAAKYGIPAVASYLSTRTQNNANDKANDFLQNAVMQGQQIAGNIYGNQMDLFGSARDGALGAYSPYQQVGQQGLASLAGLAGQNRADFRLPTLEEARAMPGYQFGLDQGIKGVNASAAARGGLLTGGAVKAADRFATDYATSKYGELANQKLAEYGINTANVERPWNRAMGLADLGRFGASGAANAYSDYATQAGRAGTAYGDQVTDLLTAGANANAANTQARGNNNARTYTRLADLISDYFAGRG